MKNKFIQLAVAMVALIGMGNAFSGPGMSIPGCDSLPNHATLEAALKSARDASNGGFDLDMWATVVDRDGIVCAVAFSGSNRGDQWPGSRVISAQKANTANAFSLPGLALSTANLWAATQPGGSLFGLQESNPVDTDTAYKELSVGDIGTSIDPMVGSIVGGVNVFGGGLALYDEYGTVLGAVGVSGDSSCADHNIAWRVRDVLGLDYVPPSVGSPGDNIIFDLASTTPGKGNSGFGNFISTSGFGHPKCGVGDDDAADNAAVVDSCPLGDGMSAGCVPVMM